MGGGEFQILQISRALLARGSHVLVACHAQNFEFRRILEKAGVSVHPVSPVPFIGANHANLRIGLGFLLSLYPLAKKFRPKIIGPTTFVSAIAATLLRPLLGARLIYALMVADGNRHPSFLLRFVFARLDGLMYNSAYTRESYRAVAKVDVPEFLNYSLVDDPRTSVPATAERAILKKQLLAESDCLIGYVGRISPEKGVMDYLVMAEKLNSSGRKLRFLVIGGEDRRHSEYCAAVAQFAKDQLGDAIEFTGHIPEIVPYLSVLDVLVLPTYGEGFGRVALEAAYLGVPVIGTTPGGMEEVLRHYPRSRLVSWGRPDMLEKAVEDILRNERNNSTHTHNDQPPYLQTILELFSYNALADNEIEFYRSIADKTSKRPTSI